MQWTCELSLRGRAPSRSCSLNMKQMTGRSKASEYDGGFWIHYYMPFTSDTSNTNEPVPSCLLDVSFGCLVRLMGVVTEKEENKLAPMDPCDC